MTDHDPLESTEQISTGTVTIQRPSRWSTFWSGLQLVASLILTIAFLSHLLKAPDDARAPEAPGDSGTLDQTRLVEPSGLIRLAAGTPFTKGLEVAVARMTPTSSPLLTVTGAIVAVHRSTVTTDAESWQFDSTEVLSTFADWRKAVADVAFTRTQSQLTLELTGARRKAQQKLVERLRKLVHAGTDTEKDLAAAEADLVQVQIQGRKDQHEADTAIRVAERNEAVLQRQLQQAGLEPALLVSTPGGVALLGAEVPEVTLQLVHAGMACEARMFGLPDRVFGARVRAIVPTLSKERRAMRVLLDMVDADGELKPGMFAEVGLGAEPRRTLIVPSASLVHVGKRDYVLVRSGPADRWAPRAVRPGEPQGDETAILSGLTAGEQVIGRGAILLKPVIIQSLRLASGEHP